MRKLLLLTGCLLLLGACTPQVTTLYNWDKYNETAYKYVKNNTAADEEAMLQAFQRMIDNPTGTRKVPPPGICADYGYMLVKRGKTKEGLDLLKMEVALYPESAVFVERIIKQLESE